MFKDKYILVSFFLIVSILLLLYLNLVFQPLQNSFEFDFSFLFNQKSITEDVIFYEIRLPRVLFVFLAGGAICLSGYLLQLLVQNPLADPYILGTAGGVTFGVNLSILGIIPIVYQGILLLPLWGFLFGLLVTILVVMISNRKKQINAFILVLGGVAISSFTVALSSLFIYLSTSSEKLRTIIFWAMGSFQYAQWKHIPVLLVSLVIIAALFQFYQKKLHLMVLGEQMAIDSGLKYKRFQWLIILSSCWLTAFCVSVCGPISFVGLIVPHFVRAFFGTIGRYNVIFAVLLGGGIMLLSDLLAKMAYPPVGLPIGVVTSLIGIPFFIYLLIKTSYRF